ncbi:hypothetical protein HPP92_010685 [Vanilla planifolia]|uniref:Uncharacterized protein n=1 Tax=Vanilla planifolia TaxID=51239 RepID=A0A835QZC8_VANPL|nr:hypothetical protein HPP92_010685 [Vanilla planifolia]
MLGELFFNCRDSRGGNGHGGAELESSLLLTLLPPLHPPLKVFRDKESYVRHRTQKRVFCCEGILKVLSHLSIQVQTSLRSYMCIWDQSKQKLKLLFCRQQHGALANVSAKLPGG